MRWIINLGACLLGVVAVLPAASGRPGQASEGGGYGAATPWCVSR